MKPIQTLKLREKLKEATRSFFKNLNYTEVDTPIAVISPGTEVYLDYFQTAWKDYKNKSHTLYLRSSPELHMKQLLTQDCDRIFQMAKSFRNSGELSEWHHPEFTLLEWYQKSISYEKFMEQTHEFLLATLEEMKHEFPELIKLELPKSLIKVSVKEAFYEMAKIDLVDNDLYLAEKAKQQGIISVNENDDFETAFFKIMLERIEPKFKKIPSLVLYDYPASQAALAKIEGGLAKRFEFYIKGVELCNAFLEELDPEENKKRILEANCKRKQNGLRCPAVDQEFLDSLEYKSYLTCGNALGFDRWLALMLEEKGLSKIIPFRKMAPYKQE